MDSSILDDCAETGTVVLTNDRDFVRMANERDHAGVVMYTDRRFLLDDPTNAAGALVEMNRYYSKDGMANTVEWLDNWR